MTFSRDNEAFLRSQGWSGTKWDKPRDSSYTDKDKHIYDSLLKAAGDDNQLSTAEYETIYNDRGPWGKYAYNRDSVANALAQLGSQTGIKLDQETMDRHDLTYSGDDILQRVGEGDRGPDAFKKDDYKVSWERGIEDGDDRSEVFRWASNVPQKEEEIVEKPEPEKPKEKETKKWDPPWDRYSEDRYGRGDGSIPFITELQNKQANKKGYETRFLNAFMQGKGFSSDVIS